MSRRARRSHPRRRPSATSGGTRTASEPRSTSARGPAHAHLHPGDFPSPHGVGAHREAEKLRFGAVVASASTAAVAGRTAQPTAGRKRTAPRRKTTDARRAHRGAPNWTTAPAQLHSATTTADAAVPEAGRPLQSRVDGAAAEDAAATADAVRTARVDADAAAAVQAAVSPAAARATNPRARPNETPIR